MPFQIYQPAMAEIHKIMQAETMKVAAVVERNMKKLTRVSGRHKIAKADRATNNNGKTRKGAAKEYYEPSAPGDPPHKQSGLLNQSIGSAWDAGTETAVVGAVTHYAGWVNNGTRRMAARPFARPALLAAVAGAKL